MGVLRLYLTWLGGIFAVAVAIAMWQMHETKLEGEKLLRQYREMYRSAGDAEAPAPHEMGPGDFGRPPRRDPRCSCVPGDPLCSCR